MVGHALTNEEKVWARQAIIDLRTRGRLKKRGHGVFKHNLRLVLGELQNKDPAWSQYLNSERSFKDYKYNAMYKLIWEEINRKKPEPRSPETSPTKKTPTLGSLLSPTNFDITTRGSSLIE